MRVLIVPYPDSFNVVGGHVTQQVETVAALERAGVSVRIGTPDEAFADDYDIVHFFGDVRPLLQLGRPKGRLVVSPIYFPRWFYLGPHYRRPGYPYMIIKRMRRRAALVRHPRARYRRDRDFAAMVAALGDVDLIVVNSHAEAEFLRGDAGRLPPVRVAYSGVSQSAFRGDPAEGRRLLGLGDEPFVLSVARVEPRKNTVALALALRGLPYRFVHVGTVLPGNEPYLAAIRRANPNVLHFTIWTRSSTFTRPPPRTLCRRGMRRPAWPRCRHSQPALQSPSPTDSASGSTSATSLPIAGLVP